MAVSYVQDNLQLHGESFKQRWIALEEEHCCNLCAVKNNTYSTTQIVTVTVIKCTKYMQHFCSSKCSKSSPADTRYWTFQRQELPSQWRLNWTFGLSLYRPCLIAQRAAEVFPGCFLCALFKQLCTVVASICKMWPQRDAGLVYTVFIRFEWISVCYSGVEYVLLGTDVNTYILIWDQISECRPPRDWSS